jgi:DegV family protein with EDD domain
MAVKILVDSTCDLPLSALERMGLYMEPLTVHFEGEELRDTYDIDHADFFARLRAAKKLPTTSQVPVGRFMDRYTELLGDDPNAELVVLTLSKNLSATFQSACMAKEALDNDPRIHVVDQGGTSLSAVPAVLTAVRMRDAGHTASQISDFLTQKRNNLRIFAMVDSLHHLHKGGRLGAASTVAGSLLGIKPILNIRDGVIEVAAKARGQQNAIKQIMELIAATGVDHSLPFVFGHIDARPAMEALMDAAIPAFGITDYTEVNIGAVIGTHVGPGCFGVGYYDTVENPDVPIKAEHN